MPPVGVDIALHGCATIPAGPTVMVLRWPGKTLEQLQANHAVCDQ